MCPLASVCSRFHDEQSQAQLNAACGTLPAGTAGGSSNMPVKSTAKKDKPKKDPNAPKKPSGACKSSPRCWAFWWATHCFCNRTASKSCSVVTHIPPAARLMLPDIFYCNAKRDEVKRKNPDFSVAQVGKALGEMWKQETLESKKVRLAAGWGA